MTGLMNPIETSERMAAENHSERSADSQSVPFTSLIPEAKATSSPFVKKYEMGTGKNKINVRIFKEPPPEPVMEPENSHTE